MSKKTKKAPGTPFVVIDQIHVITKEIRRYNFSLNFVHWIKRFDVEDMENQVSNTMKNSIKT